MVKKSEHDIIERGGVKMLAWTGKQRKLLADMCERGMSGSAIAEVLTKEYGIPVTRHAVIGKAQRLGLNMSAERRKGGALPVSDEIAAKLSAAASTEFLNANQIKYRDEEFVRRKKESARRAKKLQARGLLNSPGCGDAIAIPEANVRRITLLELENNSCRFAINNGGDDGFLFCGDPTADLAGNRPYCAAHAARCFAGFSHAARRAAELNGAN